MQEIVVAARSEAKKLMFIFHGYGASSSDMAALGKSFSEIIPDTEFHIPNGIEKCQECPSGYQWFDLSGSDFIESEKCFKAMNKNIPQIMTYIDKVIAQKPGLTHDDVILSGFSQGAMLALTLGLRH